MNSSSKPPIHLNILILSNTPKSNDQLTKHIALKHCLARS